VWESWAGGWAVGLVGWVGWGGGGGADSSYFEVGSSHSLWLLGWWWWWWCVDDSNTDPHSPCPAPTPVTINVCRWEQE
jgi:hypothetical protein